MVVGSIGSGGMGSLLIRELSSHGIQCIVSDISESALDNAGSAYKTTDNGHVAQESDILFYSVDFDRLEDVVKQTHNRVKPHAVISSQQSVKGPEKEILQRYFPNNPIVPIHLLFGPSVDSFGQRATVSLVQGERSYEMAVSLLLKKINLDVILLTTTEHDESMAHIQVGTHAGLEAMGSGWMKTGIEPWNNLTYSDSLDKMKRAMTHRLFSNKGELYSGIALQNPFAGSVVESYTKSVHDLFKLYDDIEQLRERVYFARDHFLQQGFTFDVGSVGSSTMNTHLSLLAAGDQWAKEKTDLVKLQRLGTPVFDMKLAMLGLLYSSESYLDSCIDNAAHSLDVRSDDGCFVESVIGWNKIIKERNAGSYRAEFDAVAEFLEPMAKKGFDSSVKYIKQL